MCTENFYSVLIKQRRTLVKNLHCKRAHTGEQKICCSVFTDMPCRWFVQGSFNILFTKYKLAAFGFGFFFFLQESEGNTFVGEQNYKQDIGGIEASVSAFFQACHSATPSFLVD